MFQYKQHGRYFTPTKCCTTSNRSETANAPPEPTAQKEINFKSRLKHDYAGLPDFGELEFTKNALGETLQISNEATGFDALSSSLVKGPGNDTDSHDRIAFRAPINLTMNVEWPDTRRPKDFASSAIEVVLEEHGGGTRPINDSTPLGIAVSHVAHVRQADGSLTEDSLPIATTFGDLSNAIRAAATLHALGHSIDYFEALNRWVAKPPITGAGEVFDPTKHNMPPEALASLQQAETRLKFQYHLIYDEALRRNPQAFR